MKIGRIRIIRPQSGPACVYFLYKVYLGHISFGPGNYLKGDLSDMKDYCLLREGLYENI